LERDEPPDRLLPDHPAGCRPADQAELLALTAQEWHALGYPQRGDPVEEAEKEHLKREVAGVLMTLTAVEARVLTLRYGLVDGKSLTLEEVGLEFGVNRELIQ
jgi:DNA-directed RNA polymerase specialized sigma subunit